MTLVFILPARIENIKIKLFKVKLESKGITLTENMNDKVTHIVSALDTVEAVWERISRFIPETEQKHFQTTCHFVCPAWLTDCLKEGRVAEVQDKHRLCSAKQKEGEKQNKEDNHEEKISEWACMRDTPLKHHNHHLTDALEVLEKEAQFIGDENNYSRALAFRRAIAQLASLPVHVSRIEEVMKLPNIGSHCKRVIQEILEDGTSTEVSAIEQSDFHKSMKELTSVFGVGEATAKKWCNVHGVFTVHDAMRNPHILSTRDERLIYGLAYHEDLSLPVLQSEAKSFCDFIRAEAATLVPGVVVELTGGFRRGKSWGHDIDLLITHPEEGKEVEVLDKIVQRIRDLDMFLYGKVESSSYSAKKLYSDDGKFNYLKSNLDHFEKFVGILKLNKCDRVNTQEAASRIKGDNLNIKNDDSNSTRPSNESKMDSSVSDRSDCVTHNDPTIKTGSKEKDVDQDYEPSSKIPKRVTVPHAMTLKSLQAEAQLERKWYARRVDLVISPWSQFYYALVGWTGSKFFNRDLRKYAQKVRNMKLTSHGLYDISKKESLPAESEREVFENLKVPYREPHLRNG